MSDTYKVYNQDKALLLTQSYVEDEYGVDLGELFLDAQVWWTDTPCPYSDGIAVIYKDRCYHGITFSCGEIYVAKKSNTTGDSALLHEFGHCLRFSMGMDGDEIHQDDKYWNLVREVQLETRERGW